MRQDGATVDVDLVVDGDIVAQDGAALETRPAAHGGVPADDARVDPGKVLDLGALENDTALETHTIAHHNIGTHHDVGTNAAVLTNLRRRMDHDVTLVDIVERGVGELGRVLLGKMAQIQAGAGQEVLGLTDVHPEALEVKGVELAVLRDEGEDLLFDGRGLELDAIENGGAEDVDACVDLVANELLGLLHEALDAGRVGLVHDHTILGGIVHFGHLIHESVPR